MLTHARRHMCCVAKQGLAIDASFCILSAVDAFFWCPTILLDITDILVLLKACGAAQMFPIV